MPSRSALLLMAAIGLSWLAGSPAMTREIHNDGENGYGIVPTGLTPRYPDGWDCSPLTSLYASWVDVDGLPRKEIHSGVDGGRLGETILAPAAGAVRAVWEANWGWGREGALLIRHSRADLNLRSGPPFYYSAFYHMRLEDTRAMQSGGEVRRGQVLGSVSRPGGKRRYLPEVHWEVYEVSNDDALVWDLNDLGFRYWMNASAKLVDPLELLGLEKPPLRDGSVLIQPFAENDDFAKFRGFTYILPCRRK